jgi:hypothetical protein
MRRALLDVPISGKPEMILNVPIRPAGRARTRSLLAHAEILSAASLYHRSSQLAAAIVAGIADPNFKARLLTLAVEANPFGQFIADELAKWPKVIKLPTSSRSDPTEGGVSSHSNQSRRSDW